MSFSTFPVPPRLICAPPTFISSDPPLAGPSFCCIMVKMIACAAALSAIMRPARSPAAERFLNLPVSSSFSKSPSAFSTAIIMYASTAHSSRVSGK